MITETIYNCIITEMPILVGLILIISTVLRGFFITSVPPELFGDEVDVGYQAFSLLHSGKDLYGQTLPTYLHSLSEWRTPLLIYVTVPSVAALHNTELGVRLPEVIFGALGPVILFLLICQTSKSKSIAFLGALVMALAPWHIIYSRAAFEAVLMLDLILIGTLLLFKNKYVLSATFFALSVYTYSTAIVFTPLWILIFLFLNKKKPSIISICLFIFLVVPLGSSILLGPARNRFGLLSVFSDQEKIKQLNLLRSVDLPPLQNLIHNRFETVGNFLVSNYLRAFSSEFLFVQGDPTFRQSIHIIGELLPITAPFLLIGIAYLGFRKRWFWLAWLFIAPLPAMLTSDGGYHATRLFLMLPPLCVCIGYGFARLISCLPKLMKYIFLSLYIPIFIYSFSQISHYYLIHYPVLSWQWWQVGFKDIMLQVDHYQANYSRVFINNTYEPSLIRYLFYTQYSPLAFHARFTTDKPTPGIVTGYDGFTVDGKVFFGTFSRQAAKEGLEKYLLPNSLYVISQRDDIAGDWDWRVSPPSGIKVLATSTNPFGQPIFYLITKL